MKFKDLLFKLFFGVDFLINKCLHLLNLKKYFSLLDSFEFLDKLTILETFNFFSFFLIINYFICLFHILKKLKCFQK